MGLFDFGGSASSSRATQNPDFVWQTQQPFLTSLYQNAQTLFGNQGFQQGQAAQGQVNNLMQGAGPWANAGSNPAIQNLMQRASGQNPYIDQQVAGLGSDLGNFFKTQLLPGIQSQAGLAGQYGGGSRQSLAAGQAADSVAQQFQRGATDLRAGAYNSGTQAAGLAGSLGQASVNNLGNMFNLGMAPWQQAWNPLMNYAQMIGSPTVLNGGGSSGSWSGGFDFGICYLAREVIPDRWVSFFLWKENKAPGWFRKLYNRKAKGWAEWVRDKPKVKSVLRRVMLWVC